MSVSVALVIAFVPLTLVAALWPNYRIAPLTAAIVLLTPGAQQLGPLGSAFDRIVEITLGSVVGLGVSLALLPARAHGLVIGATAGILLQLARRRDLETELSKLARFDGRITKGARGGPKGPVAPKYRNPENPAETWAGRGLKPRWLTAAIKSGKKVEDFLIVGSPASKASGRKTAKGATAKAKRATAEVCPICGFQTTPPHDGRAHRYQKKKAPLSAAELTEKGLAKV